MPYMIHNDEADVEARKTKLQKEEEVLASRMKSKKAPQKEEPKVEINGDVKTTYL